MLSSKMNNFETKSVVRWILPTILLLIHIFYIQKLYVYGLQIMLHWICYAVLFFYLFWMGEISAVFKELGQGIRRLDFIVKAIFVFLIAFAGAMFIVFNFSDGVNTMYPLWQPYSKIGLIFWGVAYIFLQPLVDHILYYRWGMEKSSASRIMIIGIALLRTFVETGLLIYSKDVSIPQEKFLGLALWLSMIIFSIVYIWYKNTTVSYISEVMYRGAVVMTVFIGMTQYYIPF